ncbi:MAG: excinuclease ABC subunit UvrA [Candidatus Moranbacteria bacterium]|nr:excinuclease ABC subunit UvrA [Candidatus Moranbacteria bacterium]
MSKNNPKDRSKIIVRGARVNNLKNIDVEIPRDKLVVITGLSGSGKSSLAFDAIYAEGNRRYLEGMSSYATQFLDVSAKPDVDKIENLTPTISIDQKSIARSPRSTVGTLTEIYDYLRVLYAKVGVPHCPHCKTPLEKITNSEVLEDILDSPDKTNIAILAKLNGKEQSLKERLKSVSQLGYARIRLKGKIMSLTEALSQNEVENDEPCNAEIVIDRIVLNKKNPDRERILDSIETAFKLGKGTAVVTRDNETEKIYNRDFVCKKCSFEVADITPKHFSFNSPEGACQHCSGLGVIKEIDEDLLIPNKNLTLAEGAILSWNKSGGRSSVMASGNNILKMLGDKYGFSIDIPVKKISREHLNIVLYGSNDPKIIFEGVIPTMKKKYEELNSNYLKSEIERYMIEKVCPLCAGKRLKGEYLSVLVAEKSIDQVVEMSLVDFSQFLEILEKTHLSSAKKNIILPLVKEMKARSGALQNVGLGYLSLSRSANSISGGEGQRIRLATQIGSELSGITYVLDEPSIGLHNRDTEKLVATMEELREAGNSLITVEHDEQIIRKADWIIDMGPGAGEEGGEVIFSGDLPKLLKSKTLTAQYLNGKRKVGDKKKARKGSGKFIRIFGATEHNLKNIDVNLPLGKFISLTGVSGSGKSTLVSDILSKGLAKYFFNTKETPGKHKKISGMENVDKVISINQSPIGRTPRSNAATYTGVFSLIRELFAETEEAHTRGYDASRFSFNMKGGRCEDCQGEGKKKIEMHLLPDVYVPCETCNGAKYNLRTLEIEYRGVNVAQVLDMSVSYALAFFKNSKLVTEKLSTLEKVGLGYLKLGQSAVDLSGGEAQRIKLATELSRRATGKTLYILDEPTIGLHFEDIRKLLGVLDALVDKGNTVLVVEHNVDVIRNSDWVIDLGPEGGNSGGEIVFEGTPAELKKCKMSWTGKYL